MQKNTKFHVAQHMRTVQHFKSVQTPTERTFNSHFAPISNNSLIISHTFLRTTQSLVYCLEKTVFVLQKCSIEKVNN